MSNVFQMYEMAMVKAAGVESLDNIANAQRRNAGGPSQRQLHFVVQNDFSYRPSLVDMRFKAVKHVL